METITLSYNPRNKAAQAFIKFLRTLSFIKVSEDSAPQYDPDMVAKIRRGEEDIKNGRCESIKLEELWN